ncbi:DMT family transporter [Alkalibacillus aidingensis]|uniref:DMT family transporter n=1 Tax=Alkalibacillus aidingensis TaxID=2747607 RepID=UPI0016603213|nr:multidrug efflux SMR transporter [Alkalibacillus aidingensis]
MNHYWAKLLAGAFFEVIWVIGLKHASNVSTWLITVVAIFLSFYLLIISTQKLPVGTAYAVFAGLGTAGTVIAEFLFFGEPFDLVKMAFISLLLIGIVGLKLVTEEQGDK